MITTQNLIETLEKHSNIDRKLLRRILILLEFALRKKDGSPTAFAQKFNIKNFEDLYNFFKQTKEALKKDHENVAFNNLTEAWKSVASRTQYWIMETFNEQNERDALFAASIFVMRTLGIVLDNLVPLRKIVKILDESSKVVTEYVNLQKFEAEDRE